MEENHSYSSVIGNAAMPYLNRLASQYGLATQYYANTHPSIGNYFMLTTGQMVTFPRRSRQRSGYGRVLLSLLWELDLSFFPPPAA